jgi:hypothetical protein
MTTWFRVYGSLVDDPKVQRLPCDLFKALVNLWCLASQNGGVLPSIEDIAFKLRVDPEEAADIVVRLSKAGLIDHEDAEIRPHNWDKRQFKSDGSTERVKRFRERERNVSVTGGRNVSPAVSETGPEQNRADTEQSRADAPPASNDFGRLRVVVPAKNPVYEDLRNILGPSRCTDLSRVESWLSKGYAPATIVEVVKALVARKTDISSLNYFDAAIAERHARRSETPSERAAARAAIDMDSVVSMWARTGVWSKYAGPEPGLSGCRASAEVLARHGFDERGAKIRKVG